MGDRERRQGGRRLRRVPDRGRHDRRQILDQRATGGDVQHLRAPADRQDRHVAVERGPRERKLVSVARRVDLHRRVPLALAIFQGIDVDAAGQQQPVAGAERGARLVARGIEVHARHGASRDEFDADLLAVADTRPEIVVDDGCELTARLVEHRPELAAGLAGMTEETTTGIARLRAMESAGRLTFPAVAANDALCKHLFDNRYGTGQSTLDGVIRATDHLIAGKRVVVAGYGYCGKGVASRARGMGAQTIVTEIDPIKAIEAVMDGDFRSCLSHLFTSSAA